MPPIPARLVADSLGKRYVAPVLQAFHFELEPGEVHALVGSNGAGKSTFARIVAGIVAADAGTMRIDGQPYSPTGHADAIAAGVVMVHQELNIVPTLSIAENLFLDRMPARFGVVDRRALRHLAGEALARVGLEAVDPFAPAGVLGVGRQQLVEIAAALARDCRLLILDEPTAALTAPEVDQLFANIRRLREAGVGVIYISHRMDEIRRIADRVTVLRDGQRVGVHPAGEVTPRELVREMAGHEMASAARTADAATARGAVALKVENLVSEPEVRGVSFEARRGEVLGIAGLVGSGRSETLHAIIGDRHVDRGGVRLGEGGELITFRSPAEAVARGIGLIPEDRKNHGLLFGQSVRVNTTLATIRKHANRWGVLSPDAEATTTREQGARLGMACASLDQDVAELSGGNQQKVVVGRWLARDCEVLLFDEPTRGIDVPAKDVVHALLRELAAAGKAVVVVSSDLPELMTVCDRIAVMSAGRIADEFLPGNWTEETITRAAFSGYLQPASTSTST